MEAYITKRESKRDGQRDRERGCLGRVCIFPAEEAAGGTTVTFSGQVHTQPSLHCSFMSSLLYNFVNSNARGVN